MRAGSAAVALGDRAELADDLPVGGEPPPRAPSPCTAAPPSPARRTSPSSYRQLARPPMPASSRALSGRRTQPPRPTTSLGGAAAQHLAADAPVAHLHDAVGELRRGLVVADDDERGADLRHELGEQPVDRARRARVELAGRLVGQEQRGLMNERRAGRDALLLAARELRRRIVGALRKAHGVEQREGALPPLAAARPLRAPAAERRCRRMRARARGRARSADRGSRAAASGRQRRVARLAASRPPRACARRRPTAGRSPRRCAAARSCPIRSARARRSARPARRRASSPAARRRPSRCRRGCGRRRGARVRAPRSFGPLLPRDAAPRRAAAVGDEQRRLDQERSQYGEPCGVAPAIVSHGVIRCSGGSGTASVASTARRRPVATARPMPRTTPATTPSTASPRARQRTLARSARGPAPCDSRSNRLSLSSRRNPSVASATPSSASARAASAAATSDETMPRAIGSLRSSL